MSVVSRVPEVALPRPEVSHRSIQVAADRGGWRRRSTGADATPGLSCVGDLIVLALALGTAQVVRFGAVAATAGRAASARRYAALGVALAGDVVGCRSRCTRRAAPRSSVTAGRSTGASSSRRSACSRCWRCVSVALKIDASRLYLATAFPLGLVGLLVERKLARVSLHRARMRGRGGTPRCSSSAASGPLPSSPRGSPSTRPPATTVCGVWVPDESAAAGCHHWRRAARRPGDVVRHSTSPRPSRVSGATTVVVTDTEHLGHESLRDLAWQLEGSSIDLILSPNVLNVSSSRLLPPGRLGHADAARERAAVRRRGPAQQARSSTSSARSILLVAAAPLFVATALAVKVSSPGRGLLPPGANRPQRRALRDDQVPLDAVGRRQPAGRAARGRGQVARGASEADEGPARHARWVASSVASRSTSSRSCSTSSRAT